MTNLRLDDDLLRKQPNLIILYEFYIYYESTNSAEIQYSTLRQKSDDRLRNLTSGERYPRDQFGGSFENHIKDFEGKDDPKTRLITRDKRGPKNTVLIGNMVRIRAFLEASSLTNDIPKQEWDEQAIDQTMWFEEEKRILEYEMKGNNFSELFSRIKHRRDYNFLIGAFSEYQADVRMKQFNYTILHEPGKNFSIRKEDMRLLVYLMYLLRTRNNYPFKLICEYRPPIDENGEFSVERSESDKKFVEYFARWMQQFHDTNVRSEDRKKLMEFLADPKGNKTVNTGLDHDLLKYWIQFQEDFSEFAKMAIKNHRLPPLSD